MRDRLFFTPIRELRIMAYTLETAFAELLKEGSPYQTGTETIRGVESTIFSNAPNSLHDLYTTALTLHGDKDFLVYEDERWTHKEAYEDASRLAQQLKSEFGVEPGDRVAIAMRNYPELVLSLMAATSIGAVAVPMNAWWTSSELEYALNDCSAKVVVADVERLERLESILDKVPAKTIGVRTDASKFTNCRCIKEMLQAAPSAEMPAHDIHTDDNALILYTSGTTGHPKGALSSHRSIVSALLNFEVSVFARAMVSPTNSVGSDTKFPPATLIAVPLFHVTGLHTQVLLSFRIGRKVVLMYKWDPEKALELIERERVTMFTGVPTMGQELMNTPSWGKRDVSSLKDIASGGAPKPPEQIKQFAKKNPSGRPGQGYGLTETNAVGAVINGDDYITRPASVGQPTYPMVQARIVDEQGNELPTGERGEVCFKSVCLIKEYFNKPEATAKAIKDGWFNTGDIGYLDEEGFLFLVDRAKDLIIRGGENISCSEVEAALYEHPGIDEVAVFGVPDDRLGETVAAMVLLKPGTEVSSEELIAHAADRIAKFKVPQYVWFTDSQLTRGATGKILKREIKKAAIEKYLQPELAEA